MTTKVNAYWIYVTKVRYFKSVASVVRGFFVQNLSKKQKKKLPNNANKHFNKATFEHIPLRKVLNVYIVQSEPLEAIQDLDYFLNRIDECEENRRTQQQQQQQQSGNLKRKFQDIEK